MTDTMSDEISRPHPLPAGRAFLSRLFPSVLVYWLVTAVAMALIALPTATDLIGPDNDDVMRLVEVRDWLGGQGWFDMMQYRLGLGDGTLMHWSRLVDAPIGLLITLFSTVMPMELAEGVTASVWPLLLVGPLLFAIGLAGCRMGGVRAMHVALGLGVLYTVTCIKFRPGALDHHNVQLVLAMTIAALLVDRKADVKSHAAAGVAAALAIAVGAETIPFFAAACFCVAVRWIWQGALFAPAARAFGLSLALAITAIFVATVPPSAYSSVTCDNLSFGFYSLAALGGAGLFGLSWLPAGASLVVRGAAAAVLGAFIAAAAVFIAPQCLASPLANLDPMLVELWLNKVTEAQSVLSELRHSPDSAIAFYVVGLLAILICIARIWRHEDRGLHLLFLVLLAVTWGVALVQIRGAFFSNLLAIPPFALLIADLQCAARRHPKNLAINLAFVLATLASPPAVWALGGGLISKGISSVNIAVLSGNDAAEDDGECSSASDMAALARLPAGTVAAASNTGADILRFTPHRVLAAPYHRNQGGMLTELHIGMAKPDEALAFLKGADVTIVAFCKTDAQTSLLIGMKPDGLYASLARGEVPAYLKPVQGNGKLRLFTVEPGSGN